MAALERAEALLKRRDAAHCTAAFAAVDGSAFKNRDRRRLEFDREHCLMLSGHCAEGMTHIAALNAALHEPPISTQFDADYWCLPDDPSADAETRKKRLFTQVDSFHIEHGACDRYVKPVRAYAAQYGTTDGRGAAILLTEVAKCMSADERCKEAHELLAEAQKFIPALDESELTMDCR